MDYETWIPDYEYEYASAYTRMFNNIPERRMENENAREQPECHAAGG